MRKMLLTAAATAALTFTAGAASAQSWMPINARQAMLDQRIDAGIRTGDLTRTEAQAVRNEFRALANMEARYRANGLTLSERADLDRRFSRLEARVAFERTDNQRRDWFGGRDGWTDNRGRWVNIEQRKAQLDRRIDQGVRSGQLNSREAARLRSEFNGILRMEARMRVNGLSMSERAQLDRQFDILAMRVQDERRDGDRRYGYNRY